MLISLHIENIAVIRSVELEFNKGFTALTGETGAGKSIILDSLGLLLGAKADKELVRRGESVATVAGLFGDLSAEALRDLTDAGFALDEDGRVYIQRTLTSDGRSQIRINGRAANLSVLRVVARSLVSIHGQSDTGALTDPAKHIELVDTYASNALLLEEYGNAYTALIGIRSEIEDISKKESERERLKEMLAYQIEDIDSARLHDGEEEELVDKKVKIKNSEKISKNCDFVYKALKGSEKGSVSYLIGRSITAITQLSGVIPSFSDYSDRLSVVLGEVNDIAEEVAAVLDDMDVDPNESLNKIESRLDKISRLKRKYGLTVRDILDFRDKAREELDKLENAEALLKDLEQKERQAYDTARALAEQLHERRCNASRTLDEQVRRTLEFLDMPKVVFYTSIRQSHDGERLKLNATGCDELEFYISANRGADAQSISKIASGGELARIMLALKSVIAGNDGVSTIIFDEIDTGVSGKTARKIGIKMRSLARASQIFCVTHSAQIASLADVHFLIRKSDVNGATETTVCALDYEGRVGELSRILGGLNVTEAQRKAAIDMLNERDPVGDDC